ncbi:MAG TPA: hypothetical protein ENH32_02635 [Proteobacteria bacterium]|nr:hypothetical protein BMS3Abin14_01021 [bacterium BMS3Abin14]HDL52851.1 hypothetical protein [Pseudomonadota bacterium]
MNRLLFCVLTVALLFPSSSFGEGGNVNLGPRGLNGLEPHYRSSVLRGWRSFQTSYAKDGVACINCHRSYEEMAAWAGAYPKVQVFDGTPYAVKSLSDVVLEALERHTDLSESSCMKMVDDLVACIAWWGDGQPVTPGFSGAGRPPSQDRAKLEEAVARGRILFKRRGPSSCSSCHSPRPRATEPEKTSMGDSFTTFPRYDVNTRKVVSLKTFLLWHEVKYHLSLDPEDVTDISAYLARLASRRLLRPGTPADGSPPESSGGK